jgi:hypothetical protein
MPRGPQPYKQRWQATFVAIFFVLLMTGVTVGTALGGLARWTLAFPWLMVPLSTYCYFRGRASRTVIPGVYWGLGQMLSALAAVVLLLVLF